MVVLEKMRRKFYYTKLRNFIRYKGYKNDKDYILQQYKKRFGYDLNLINPVSFNEKNNWRKLYDRKEYYTDMVDKFKVKKIIKDKVGDNHTFKLLGCWKNAKEIDFETLPDKFVLKVNHAGGVIVCRDKNTFDYKIAIEELNNNLKLDYYLPNREWPYKDVKRKIIAEEYMGENLTDYKTYCFNGEPQYIFVWDNESRINGRKPNAFFCGAYDKEWNKSEIKIGYPSKNIVVPKPEQLNELLNITRKMSENLPFVRVDCYIINGKVYVGELTFFPWSGYMKFEDPKWDIMLGGLENLEKLDG